MKNLHNAKQFDWIVFDVGDVLLNWKSGSNVLAEYLGVSKDELLDAVFLYADDMFEGKISPTDGWIKILTSLKVDGDPWDMILRWRDRKGWFDASLQLVKDLGAQGYNLAIMSNSWLGLGEERDADKLPEEIKLFTHIFDSSKEGMKKPDPRFYDLVQEKLCSSNLLLIDDSIKNAAPAEERGWNFFQYLVGDDMGLTAAKNVHALLK